MTDENYAGAAEFIDAVKVTGGKSENIEDLTALEDQVTVLLNGVTVTSQVATSSNRRTGRGLRHHRRSV